MLSNAQVTPTEVRRAIDRLSPRQRACLDLVWAKRATSKEIAVELGISKATVDGYIAEAVELLGARDRREAAAIAFGEPPRAASGDDPAGVVPAAPVASSSSTPLDGMGSSWSWRTARQPRNALTLSQTIAWIAVIALGSLAALALAMSVGNGLPSVALPLVHAVHRLTQ